MATSFVQRIRRLRADLAKNGLDALLVGSPADWYYLTGFSGEAGLLVITRKSAALITDSRFTVQARAEMRGVKVVLQVKGLLETAGKWLADSRLRKVGFDPQQVTVAQLKGLRKG